MRRVFMGAIVLLLIAIAPAAAQSNSPTPQGSSLPALGSIPVSFDGPGYLEFSADHSSLNAGNPSWNDGYVRGAISGGHNTLNGEISRQSRFGESGWFGSLGWTRVLTPNWYGSLYVGSSVGGIFLPKLRADAFLYRKLLPSKQLVLGFGSGYDKSKTINSAYRNSALATYYFSWPVVLDGGVEWTRSQPDGTLARTQFLAITEGRQKEHYITVRAEIGREAYEIAGPSTTYFNFPIHKYSASYRQWLGANFGVNFSFERDINRFYHRNGGSIAFFVDF